MVVKNGHKNACPCNFSIFKPILGVNQSDNHIPPDLRAVVAHRSSDIATKTLVQKCM